MRNGACLTIDHGTAHAAVIAAVHDLCKRAALLVVQRRLRAADSHLFPLPCPDSLLTEVKKVMQPACQAGSHDGTQRFRL